MSDNLGEYFDFTEKYLFVDDDKNRKNLIIINLKTKAIKIKENILDGKDIRFIKTDKINKCVVIASWELDKVCLVDFKGNKLTNNPVHPFSLIFCDENKFYVLN